MEQASEDELPDNTSQREVLTPVIPNISDHVSEISKTPKISQDEFIIQQRGRRCKPITWSPVDYNKSDLLGKVREKTPEKFNSIPEVNLKLRRRLIMSPGRSIPGLGDAIAKKLKLISRANNDSDNKD